MDIAAKRGVKRKRESYAEPEEGNLPKLQAKLHHGLKAVKKTCKKAKAFETQRIVKKLKDAKQAGGEDITKIKTLESQLDCLKHIDLEGIAIKALRSKIKKDALLSKDADCQEAMEAELPSSTTSKPAADVGPPERTVVESRLMSSKILSAEITDVIASLRAVLDANRQESLTASDGRHSEDGEDEEVAPMKPIATTSERKSGVNERPSSVSDEDDENEDTRQEAEDNDQAAWTGFNNENPSGSEREDNDEDVIWDSDSDLSQNYDDRSDVSNDDDVSSISSHSISPPRTRRTKTVLPKEKLKGRAGESTFLPSLAIGFISGSNSDSDWSSDAEAHKIADLPVKKNRRGQRARKAIWEKKYGKNANHLRKQRENEVNAAVRTAYGKRGGPGQRGGGGRGGGAGANRGDKDTMRGNVVRGRGQPISSETHATPPHHKAHQGIQGRGRGGIRKTYEQQQRQHAAQGNSETNAPSNVRFTTPTTRPTCGQVQIHDDHKHMHMHDSKPLHPSWEAKRKLKEKLNPAIVPPMGTKIKFT